MNSCKKMIIHGINCLKTEEIWISFLALFVASVSPNIFPIAQAGYAKMSDLSTWFLVPSVILLAIVICYSWIRNLNRLWLRILVGIAGGLIATIGLELVRYPGFRLGWMPGNLPQLMGVLITDTFMQGPSLHSDVAGYMYHYWNGACFGMIYTIVFGRKEWYWGIVYGVVIAIGFLASPAVSSLGIGFMGLKMLSMPITVIVAHIAYGAVLGILSYHWLRNTNWLLQSSRSCFCSSGHVNDGKKEYSLELLTNHKSN